MTKFARRAVERARREVDRRRGVRPDDAEGLHRLRIAYKRLRYTADTFADALPSELAALAQPAARLQGRLGDLHDVDIALGCVVSLAVGLLFWPRGARFALRRALADAYKESADFLAGAVDFGVLRCDASAPPSPAPSDGAARAGAAARRLDDAFRGFLAERGAKPAPLAEVTSLVTGAGALRLAADAVLDLWARQDGSSDGDRAAARRELLQASELVKSWYEDFARSLVSGEEPRAPLPHDDAAEARLLDAIRDDLSRADAGASATAVRIIWTDDHLDAARRMQEVVLAPAQVDI